MTEQVLFIFTSLFTMINPLAAVPLYIALTQTFSAKTRLKVAATACGTAFVAMVIFAMAGEAIFNFFGINVNALRVVGGILFFIMGFEMLRGRTVPKKFEQETDENFGKDIAITPLGIPMICGPGAITMVILFMQEADSQEHTLSVVAGILLVCIATAIIFAVGEGLLKALGKIGANVMMRLMGLIMMLIAVEFFFSGITFYIKMIASQL
ncbi:MarC family protein [Alteromonadaceae bacterium M269]|nr:MarC family protein [Alteromonadaceae bacterium M269]